MNAIAEELDRRLRSLDPDTAARCEQLVRNVLDSLDEKTLVPVPLARRNYETRTHNSGLMPGIDPTKLGQLADEL